MIKEKSILLKNNQDRNVISLLEQLQTDRPIQFSNLYKRFGKSTFYDNLKKLQKLEQSLNIKIFKILKEKNKRSYRTFLQRIAKIDIKTENNKISTVTITEETT